MKNCCKVCNKPVRLYNGLKVSSMCVSCRKEKELEKKAKHQQTKGWQKARFKTLHKKAWTLFSEFIRRDACDWALKVKCYTCDTVDFYKHMQAGHYFHNKLDFDERNIHVQCPQCNLYKSGNLAEYGVNLCKELGTEGMEKLRLDSNTIHYTIEDLERIIADTEQKLRELG